MEGRGGGGVTGCVGVREQVSKRLTVRCWKSHALMMLVATLGKIPRFLLCFFSFSGSSSSPVLGEATLLSRPSPVTSTVNRKRQRRSDSQFVYFLHSPRSGNQKE